MIPYNVAYLLAIVLMLINVAINLTVGMNEALELGRRTIAILSIIAGVITAALAFLPAVNSRSATGSNSWRLNERNITSIPKEK